MSKRMINIQQRDNLETIKNNQLTGMTYKKIAEEYSNYLKSNNIYNDDNVELETLTSRVESWFYGRSTVRREFVDYLRLIHHINPRYINGESKVMLFPFDIKYDVLLDLIDEYKAVPESHNSSIREHSLTLSIDSHFIDYLIAKQMEKQASSHNSYSKLHSKAIQDAIHFQGEEDIKEYILVPMDSDVDSYLKYEKNLCLNNRVSKLKSELKQLEAKKESLVKEKVLLEEKTHSIEKLIDRLKGIYDTYVDNIIFLLVKLGYPKNEARKMSLKLVSDLALIEE